MVPYAANPYNAKEGTPFENGAEFDIAHDIPENMVPAGEYFDRQRELAQLAKTASEAAESGLVEYAKDGIKEIEQSLSELENVRRVSAMLEWVRTQKLNEGQ